MHLEKHTFFPSLFCLCFQGFGASPFPCFPKFKGVTKLLIIQGIFVGICSSRAEYYFVKPLVGNE